MALRDLKKERLWRRMVRGQADSGLAVRAFSGKHGVKRAGFYWWRAELVRRDAQAPRPAFVPVRLTEDEPAGDGGWVEILLAGDRRVRVGGRVDRRMLADVLAVLEGPAC